MRLKKIVLRIHLWLGLTSGLIVVLLGITGCILAFENEIRGSTESFRKVEVQTKDYLPPSALKSVAERHLSSGKALGIEYPGTGKAAVAGKYLFQNFERKFACAVTFPIGFQFLIWMRPCVKLKSDPVEHRWEVQRRTHEYLFVHQIMNLKDPDRRSGSLIG